jgi:hypothetical protein
MSSVLVRGRTPLFRVETTKLGYPIAVIFPHSLQSYLDQLQIGEVKIGKSTRFSRLIPRRFFWAMIVENRLQT